MQEKNLRPLELSPLRAEAIIKNHGGHIDKYNTIHYFGEDQEVLDAVMYLVNEWDYDVNPYKPFELTWTGLLKFALVLIAAVSFLVYLLTLWV
jgi:hypothetical protein